MKTIHTFDAKLLAYALIRRLLSRTPYKKKTRRKLGILEGKGTIRFAADFKMTEKEFLNL